MGWNGRKNIYLHFEGVKFQTVFFLRSQIHRCMMKIIMEVAKKKQLNNMNKFVYFKISSYFPFQLILDEQKTNYKNLKWNSIGRHKVHLSFIFKYWTKIHVENYFRVYVMVTGWNCHAWLRCSVFNNLKSCVNPPSSHIFYI